MKFSQANTIKIFAVITAAPRWVIALLAAEGFVLPDAWLGWWVVVSAFLSLGMAVVEGFAFSYIFNAWRVQKDKSADNLLYIALASALVFVGVMSPSIAAGVRRVPLGDLLTNDWLLYAWAVFVSLSTIVIVAGVGYAEKQVAPSPAKANEPRSEPRSERNEIRSPANESEHSPLEAETAQYICGGCGRVLGSQNALNAHRGRCSAKQNGHAPAVNGKTIRRDVLALNGKVERVVE
jgi:hypothetical protein